MNPKEKFLDRIEQTFMTLVQHKELLIGATVIYGSMYILSIIVYQVLASLIVLDVLFFTHSVNYIILIIGIVIWLVWITAYIGIILGFIKYLSDVQKGLPLNLQTSILWGIKHILSSFYTYYYIFLYVYLIPTLFLMSGLILILLDLTQGRIGFSEGLQHAQYANIGLILIGISFFIGIYFMFYRGIKSSFAIYHAVDTADFSKTSFEKSLHLSDNQWVRVFGNIVGMGIIIGLVSSIFSGLFSLGGSAFNMSSIMTMKELDPANIKHILSGVSSIGIGGIFSSILSGIGGLFLITFIYLFFKRLEVESSGEKIVEESGEIIALTTEL